MAETIVAGNEAASMGALLAAPIVALQEAQIEAEKQVVEFILEYGLKDAAGADGQPELAALTFRMMHAIPDPSNAGSVVRKRAEVSVPLLSLMRLPALRVDNATVDLVMEISAAQAAEVPGPEATGGTTRPEISDRLGGHIKRIERLDALRKARNIKPLIGKLASKTGDRNAAKINVTMTIKSAGEDEFYQRLTRFIGDALTAVITEPQT